MSYILGIDYGKSKVGLATADIETRLAFSYGTLKKDKKMLQKLAKIVEKNNISKAIIGTTDMKTSSSFELSISKLTEFLTNNLKIKVEFQTEIYSTKQAHRNLIERGVKRLKRFDDQEAARIILQSWLDKPK